MRILLTFLLITMALTNSMEGAFSFGQEEPRIFINNRILARVNDKALSVMDVMKKMDMHFYKQFPQYTSSIPARHQFYQVNWKHVLQELIDKELVMADAAEHKLPLTSGDIRQEMERLFGPNIIVNLDKVNLTFDEAWEMIKEDITIRRMIYIMANAKAMKLVTPKDVKKAYEEYIKTNKRPEEWQYMVISIRDPDAKRGEEAAKNVYQLLTEQGIEIDQLTARLNEQNLIQDTTKINISELYRHQEKDISSTYKEALAPLAANSYSQPVSQTSRADKSTVYRVFYLKDHTLEGVPQFYEMEATLQNQLLDEAIDKETVAYIERLRKHYHLLPNQLDLISADFQPFVLR